MLCALGKLGIVLNNPDVPSNTIREAGDWRYLALPAGAVISEMPTVMQTIEQQVEKLGGPLASH